MRVLREVATMNVWNVSVVLLSYRGQASGSSLKKCLGRQL